MTSLAAEPQRRGRRRRRPDSPDTSAPAGPNLRRLTNPFPAMELLSADQVEAIHETSLTILEELGIRVLHDEGRRLLAAAGCLVDESDFQVRFDKGLVMETIAKAPSVVELVPRNPARAVSMGGNGVAFATVGGPPNVSDLEGGRRAGTLAAFEDFMRLGQSFDVVHLMSPAVEPIDLAPGLRHLAMSRAMMVLTDKVPFIYSRGTQAVADSFEILRLAHGLDRGGFAAQPHCFTVVNANSPRQLDWPMTQGIIDFAQAGQLMVLTPFTLAGAMAPVSVAGALAQQNAEALAGLALAQIVRSGAPVMYGGFTSNVDMKSGAPAFGTPEYVQAAFASGQLARRYGLPWRSSNVNASNAPDAQSAYESQMAIWGALLGKANLLLHGAGWLEGGLTASYEKFIIDVEMLQMMAHVFEPMACDEGALALEAVREVGPGGHYFGAAHTLARYQTAFYPPILSDWRNFETWSETGSEDTARRAHRIYKETLRNFQPPPLEDERRAAIDDFVSRRTAEGGADLES
ncbi:MAG: trimethylamine methyltransferase family protein [Pseudomonadota bacterium]